VPIVDHQFYDLLNGGTGMFSGGLLLKVITLHLDLAGQAFLFKQRDAFRTPVAAWPIPPHWVTSRPTVDDSSPFYTIECLGKKISIPRSEIIHFLDPDPLNPYGPGMGAGAALGDEANIASALARHIGAYWENHAIPPLVVMPKVPIMGTDTVERLKLLENKWIEKTQGKNRRGVPYFSNIELMIKELSGKFEENQVAELLRLNWDICRQTLGEPPEIIGDIRNANRSTIGAAYDLHARLNLVPRLEYLCGNLQIQLIEADYDDRLILTYESPVDLDNEFRKGILAYAPEAWTVDEIRDLAHLPPDTSGNGNLRIMRKGASFRKLAETEDVEVEDGDDDVPTVGNGHDTSVDPIGSDDNATATWQRQVLAQWISKATPDVLNAISSQFSAQFQ
jgi:hypothetical protein